MSENTVSYNCLGSFFYKIANPEQCPKPTLLFFNKELASELDFEFSVLNEHELAEIFCGNKKLNNTPPIALAYAGHQFGHFVPQLGDGRAHLIGELKGRDIQLKGSGRTFFSRRGDGKSALGPVVREYIMSEAMHKLGIPSTRALAAVSTGEFVQRDKLQQGGIFTRVSKGHMRVGTFEFASAHGGREEVKKLADYCIERFAPELSDAEEKYLQFYRKVAHQYLSLVAKWMGIGFIHGVMNTDNTSIAGETIDYGPCAFMDEFSFDRVFSSIDQNGRYRYANQPSIAMWNLTSLANCFISLLSDDSKVAVKILEDELNTLWSYYELEWVQVMGKKLGIMIPTLEDKELIEFWLNHLQEHHLDFTNSHRNLIDGFNSNEFSPEFNARWKERLRGQVSSETLELMKKNNPIYIPRNHLVEKAIEEAYEGNLSFAKKLMNVLEEPFRLQEGCEEFLTPPGISQKSYKTFCGT